ncbi:MAG: DNA-3-methyladenine glycosylase I [Flavobacteriales bacterium]
MYAVKKRCQWCLSNQKMIQYHDNEWGVPLNDDDKWFEYILLESFQAGLSWQIILSKRDGFRQAFHQFDVNKVAQMSEVDIERLKDSKNIVRNTLKIKATINNAKAFISIQKEFGSFNKYIWSFTDNKVIHNEFENIADIPTKTTLSDKVSKELIARGFKFVGSTICYAFLQASGIINDHSTDCFRYKEIKTIKFLDV